jgi:hypothetical protein
MAKWNYLTYNRICHDSFPIHHAKSEAPIVPEEARSVAHESNAAAVAVVVVDSVEQVIMVHLPRVLHRN